jgi:hypothetical protein
MASAEGSKSRYATFGFNDTVNLDEGVLRSVSFTLGLPPDMSRATRTDTWRNG